MPTQGPAEVTCRLVRLTQQCIASANKVATLVGRNESIRAPRLRANQDKGQTIVVPESLLFPHTSQWQARLVLSRDTDTTLVSDNQCFARQSCLRQSYVSIAPLVDSYTCACLGWLEPSWHPQSPAPTPPMTIPKPRAFAYKPLGMHSPVKLYVEHFCWSLIHLQTPADFPFMAIDLHFSN